MEFYGTLGDACAQTEILERMFQLGMTGMRLNLSHTSLAACDGLLRETFYPAARRAGVQPKLILDLQGPELRVGDLPRSLPFSEGETVILGAGRVPIPEIVLGAAQTGQQIALDDSALLLEVTGRAGGALTCRVLRGGVLNSRKSLALLGTVLDTPALTQEDLANLDRAGLAGATHVLQPFVRNEEDLKTVRQALDVRGLSHVQIMAKIENAQGLEHLEEILAGADEICIARGDLGNGMPLWELPGVQKHIARRCREAGRPFCLVTQLLWSMEQRPVPTRAEVCDIYNGVLDGASSLMLTGETAVGRYPVQAMEYLVRTARQAMADLERGV